jgi:hypothetical protein
MAPDDVKAFLGILCGKGLLWLVNGQAEDMVVVDQRTGPTTPCTWITGGRHVEGYSAVWLAGTEPGNLVAPANWTPEQSEGMNFIPTDQLSEKTLKLATNGTLEVWLNFDTGKETFLGRTNQGKGPDAAESQ